MAGHSSVVSMKTCLYRFDRRNMFSYDSAVPGVLSTLEGETLRDRLGGILLRGKPGEEGAQVD
jgi:hypothetical protein